MVGAVVFSWAGTLVDDDEEDGRRLAATTHALLETLRRRGVKLAVVAPPDDGLERLGIVDRVDVVVLCVDDALAELGVGPEDALFVGDRLEEDLRGAREAGLTTVQALWFRADEAANGLEPDYTAFTQMDVLNLVDRLNRD